ncbi:HSP90 family protein [Paenibacillus xylanilyticus]|uniref:HSP90 family protein n=1 Tax=Paenibacillus xylanilyticus TaxID=248903 RepID=A0A7Y6C2L3_9BACL|nr:HSP90 family protein [Paenibacillus xylanilyticus]NUU78635.1 HSP90 family protein [Paenibacillus xylanilyticus]
MAASNEYRFQVNLSGMIQILSNHLYSSPKVFLRELMQNATDAITARSEAEPGFQGEVRVELTGAGEQLTMMVEDNGIGLTEADIHEFLAMIGQSSKRGQQALLDGETSFIGRFGIGLLSCFMVSNEIVMLTQSAKGGPSMEWRGKPDGTYTIRQLETQLSPGTKVYLRCTPEAAHYFEPEYVKEALFYYGALLPYPVTLQSGGVQDIVNAESPAWLTQPELAKGRKAEVLAFGGRLLGETFEDFIPLTTASGRTGGIAFVLPHAVNLNAKRSHRVYLKRMLISEKAENILPEWAFFVKCLIWTDELQPTASREHFYENEKLEEVRTELGDALRQGLADMAENQTERLKKLIRLHALSMKALAVQDQAFYAMIHRWLPFESTRGHRELGELMDEGETLYFTTTVDEYRQIHHVASAQSLLVINGGYIYDNELMAALPLAVRNVHTERLQPDQVSLSFTDVPPAERNQYYDALRLADAALQRFRCRAEVKGFKPEDLPVLFTLSQESSTLRALEKASEESTDLFSSVLGSLSAGISSAGYSTLYLNVNNPIIQRVLTTPDSQMTPIAIEMLYVNALMMGHYAMNRQELEVLNQGIVRFIDWGLRANTDRKGDA